MEFYLAKDVELTFVNEGKGSHTHNYFSCSEPIPITLELVDTMEEHIQDIYLEKLCSVLAVNSTDKTILEKESPDVILKVGIKSKVEIDVEDMEQYASHRIHVKCCTTGEGTFLEQVFNAFKVLREESGAADFCDAMIQLNLQLPDGEDKYLIESVSKIKATTTKRHNTPHFCTDFIHAVSEEVASSWNGGRKRFTGLFTVILALNDAAVNSLFVRNHSASSISTFLRDMLDNEIEADTEIIPGGDGANPVKCHRAILASRSPVFRAMFQSGMLEATTNKIKIPEMSKPLIDAFVKYLYTFDVEAPLGDCRFTLEMLKAANCYDVADLSQAMYQLFMMKPAEWFDADVALDLLLYTRNLINGDSLAFVIAPQNKKMKSDVSEETMWKDLNQKAVKMLIWYSKKKPTELLASEQFKRLHEDTPQLAMELHVNFIKCADSKAWRNY